MFVRYDAGLTLIEMLVVLAIIGVASGATALSLSPSRARGVEAEAHGLAATMQSLADAAMFDDRPRALIVDRGGYRIDGGQTKRHDLPAGAAIAGPDEGRIIMTFGQPVALRIETEEESWVVEFDGLSARADRVAKARSS
ncbi:MAG: type II secretion system protein [Janthinobacterium lividum]